MTDEEMEKIKARIAIADQLKSLECKLDFAAAALGKGDERVSPATCVELHLEDDACGGWAVNFKQSHKSNFTELLRVGHIRDIRIKLREAILSVVRDELAYVRTQLQEL